MAKKLGELLIEEGLITPLQLKEALSIQTLKGGQIGSILVELGFITNEQLLELLSKKTGVPSVDLERINIPKEVIKTLPLDTMKRLHILPLGYDDNSITLAMIDPTDQKTINEIKFLTGKKVTPVVASSLQIEAALNLLKDGSGFTGKTLKETLQKKEVSKTPPIEVLLKQLVRSNASDMILVPGAPPSLKINNELTRINMPTLTPRDSNFYAKSIMNETQWEIFSEKGDIDFAITYPTLGRFRFSIQRQRGSVAITIRHIKDLIPSFEELGLPEILKHFAQKPKGFMIITGPAGQGKTTTLAALVDYINTHRRCNIITLERPIEYLHKHKNSNVIQREIGFDTPSFTEALKSVLRQSADVIVIGEMNDPETFDIALAAADTGHLLLTTMNASNTTAAVEKIINMFPSEKQNLIRAKLVDTLLMVFAQKLLKSAKNKGRVLVYEYLINSYRIKNLIKEGKTAQIRSQYHSASEDFYNFDLCLAKALKEGKVFLKEALFVAENESMFRELASKKD